MNIAGIGPEIFHRYLTPKWAFLPTSGAGAAIDGGRFKRPGVEALLAAAAGQRPDLRALELQVAAAEAGVAAARAERYPTPLETSEKDDVYVGRVREDISVEGGKGLALWVVGDQLAKGAALNAVQIGELLIRGN